MSWRDDVSRRADRVRHDDDRFVDRPAPFVVFVIGCVYAWTDGARIMLVTDGTSIAERCGQVAAQKRATRRSA